MIWASAAIGATAGLRSTAGKMLRAERSWGVSAFEVCLSPEAGWKSLELLKKTIRRRLAAIAGLD